MRPQLEGPTDRNWEARFGDLDIVDLAIAEQLLVWALRMRFDRGSADPLAKGFQVAFGLGGAGAALTSFEAMIHLLDGHGLRDLGLHAPRCRCVSLDEMLVTGVVAAVQAGWPPQARALAAWLVETTVLDDLLGHASSFAKLLRQHRLHLPIRPLIMAEFWPQSLH